MRFFTKTKTIGCLIAVIAVFFALQYYQETSAAKKLPERCIVAADVIHARAGQKPQSRASWYILTGGPGTGKTSVLEELEKRGYAVKPEAATMLIRQELANGITAPWSKPGFQLKISLLHAALIKMILRF